MAQKRVQFADGQPLAAIGRCGIAETALSDREGITRLAFQNANRLRQAGRLLFSGFLRHGYTG